MSDRRQLLVAGALLVLAAPLPAQDIREYEARADSLAQVARAAEGRLRAHNDSIAHRETDQDTVTVGPARLYVSHSLTPLVATAKRLALSDVQPAFGASLWASPRQTYAVYPQTYRAGEDSVHVAAFARIDSLGRRGGPFTQRATVQDIAIGLREAAVVIMTDAAGPRLKQWLGASLPTDTANQQWLARQRLELASAPARVARQCYDGDIAACNKALGLTPVKQPLVELYDAPSRRLLVREQAVFLPADAKLDAARCTGGDDSACTTVASSLRGTEAVLPSELHRGLMQVALEVGGAGAYSRIMGRDLDPAQSIAAVAGVPTDSVIAAWRNRIMEARAPSSTLTGGMAAASMFWMVLCAGLGLRSSRWR